MTGEPTSVGSPFLEGAARLPEDADGGDDQDDGDDGAEHDAHHQRHTAGDKRCHQDHNRNASSHLKRET